MSTSLRNVLLVDDDALVLRALGRDFRFRGYAVHEAAQRDGALEVARRVELYLAVIDLRLGRESGLEVLDELVGLQPGMHAVILTGYGSIASAVRAVRAGAVNYLSKPTTATSILAAVEGAQLAPDELPSLARVECEHVQRAVADADWNISEAARRLRIPRRTLQRKLLKRPPSG